jgi:hypothetical protein
MNEHIIRKRAILNLDYSRDNLTEEGIKSLNEYANKSNKRHLIEAIGLFILAIVPYVLFPVYIEENMKTIMLPIVIFGFFVFIGIFIFKMLWLVDRRTWYAKFLYNHLIDKNKVDTTLREMTDEEARRYYRNIQIVKIALLILFAIMVIMYKVVFDYGLRV